MKKKDEIDASLRLAPSSLVVPNVISSNMTPCCVLDRHHKILLWNNIEINQV